MSDYPRIRTGTVRSSFLDSTRLDLEYRVIPLYRTATWLCVLLSASHAGKPAASAGGGGCWRGTPNDAAIGAVSIVVTASRFGAAFSGTFVH